MLPYRSSWLPMGQGKFLHASTTGHALLVSALGLLLVFRTNTVPWIWTKSIPKNYQFEKRPKTNKIINWCLSSTTFQGATYVSFEGVYCKLSLKLFFVSSLVTWHPWSLFYFAPPTTTYKIIPNFGKGFAVKHDFKKDLKDIQDLMHQWVFFCSLSHQSQWWFWISLGFHPQLVEVT